MKNVKVDMIMEFDNSLSTISFENVEIDFFRDIVENRSKMIIKKIYKNGVEVFYHIPVNEIMNLSFYENNK